MAEQELNEALANTEEAGEHVKKSIEEFLEEIGTSVDHLSTNVSEIGERLGRLEAHALQQAAEQTAHTAKEGAVDTFNVANDAGNMAVGAVEVPGGIVEDTVHDTGTAVKEVSEAVPRPRKKIFKSRRH